MKGLATFALLFADNSPWSHAWVSTPASLQIRSESLIHLDSSVLEVPDVDEQTKTARPRIEDRSEEDAKFHYCDKSVLYWRHTVLSERDSNANIRRWLQEGAQTVVQSTEPVERAYISSSGLRTSFFASLGLLGNARAGDNAFQMDTTFRVYEIMQCFLQELEFVKNEDLQYPWDYAAQVEETDNWNPFRLQLDHRQLQPSYFLPQAVSLLGEVENILDRRARLQGKPHQTLWPTGSKTPDGREIKFPDYYLNDFHYQTDGWLSEASANKYEMSTETIFSGTQDVMQRQTILPLVKAAKSGDHQVSNILEIACGTGRFATFARDNFPNAKYTLSDLSPYYLEKARENDDYWREYRGQEAMRKRSGSSSVPTPAQVVQANAEDLPFPDNSFDTVLCVYLFHELPVFARANAAREMARVCAEGGRVVFSDSFQAGDRDALPATLMENFSKLNEPHYAAYIYDDLVGYFEDAGLVCDEKYVNSRTKTFSFIKPANQA